MRVGRGKDHYKRNAILNAALRLFLKSGYSHTSMDEIAVAAQVTKQTVYSHYHSKDALFSEIMTELCRKHAPEQLLANSDKPVEEALFEFGMVFLNMLTSKEGLSATRLAVAEAQRHPKLARRYYESCSRRRLMLVSEYLERQNARSRLKIPNTQSAASYFIALLKGSYYLRVLLNIKPHPSPADKTKHVRETVAMFMRIYGGSNPMHTIDIV